MQEREKKPGRGGRRAGAGRKASADSKSVRVSFTITPDAARKLQLAAEGAGVSRNELVNRLLESL